MKSKQALEIRNGRLYVSSAGNKGRGVFTSENIRKGELIEICPIIELTYKEHQRLAQHLLEEYVYVWRARKRTVALVMGYGSMYNHDNNFNVTFVKDHANGIMKYKALRNIEAGEELTINYGKDYNFT